MTESTPDPDDLHGTADERQVQLASLDAAGTTLSAPWLRRQLDAALLAWEADETALDIDKEAHSDF